MVDRADSQKWTIFELFDFQDGVNNIIIANFLIYGFALVVLLRISFECTPYVELG